MLCQVWNFFIIKYSTHTSVQNVCNSVNDHEESISVTAIQVKKKKKLNVVREKETAAHSSVLAWRIPGTGEPGGLPSMGSHRVGHD